MKKIIIISIICFVIGIGLGSFITGVQLKKNAGLSEKIITEQTNIINGHEEKIRQLQAILNGKKEEIKWLQTQVTRQQEKIAQANTYLYQREEKLTTDDENLEKLLEEIGNKRILFP